MSEPFYTINEIADIVSGKIYFNAPSEDRITDLLTDSRKINHASGSLFFAIKGERQDGSRFIEELFHQGVRNFIITEYSSSLQSLKANFIVVDDSLASLQTLTASHRKRFLIPIIGITGSNGKTIVKRMDLPTFASR